MGRRYKQTVDGKESNNTQKKLLKDFNFFSEGYLMKKLYVEVKDVMNMEMF